MGKRGTRWIFFFGILLLDLSLVQADALSNNLSVNLDDGHLNALAKDLGTLVGSGSFHNGRALSFPFGFDLGVHTVIVRVQGNNDILRDDHDTLMAFWGQLEVGLHRKFGLVIRGGKIMDGYLKGVGLRVGIFKPVLPRRPHFSISGLYNEVEHPVLDLKAFSVNAVLSLDFPYWHPYLGGGYDRTRLKPSEKAFGGVPTGVSHGVVGHANGGRVEAGINMSVIPFTYLSVGVGLANSKDFYHIGAGVNF